jgi:hypothetical protein
MISLTLRDDLPFVAMIVVHRGVAITVENILVDTGSASTVLSADAAASAGILPEPGDSLRRLRGVGGHEVVFTRRVDRLEVGGHWLDRFELEVAGMDYGFDISGILSMDFLRGSRVVLDLAGLTLWFQEA